MSKMNWTFASIDEALRQSGLLIESLGLNVSLDQPSGIDRVITDSRLAASGDLFVALRGERFDAHSFCAQVHGSGATALVVERPMDLPIAQWVVTDTRLALGALAKAWRNGFEIPVLAVVGSNGKTTSKEMLASICKAHWGPDRVLVTEGNLNNDIGVPLTLLRLRQAHHAAVVEMGMNHVGEIEYLASLVTPTAVLMTNAQREHQEFMKDVQAVAEENGCAFKYLRNGGVAVIPAQSEYKALWADQAGKAHLTEFGLGGEVWVVAEKSSNASAGVSLELHLQSGTAHPFSARFLGRHNHNNAAAAAGTALAAGCTLEAVIAGLEKFSPVKGRMNPVHRSSQLLLIDDSYNANPDSVNAASQVLSGLPGQTILVLGDMGEVGDRSSEYHAEVGQLAAELGVQHLLSLGQATVHSATAFGQGALHCQSIDELILQVIALVNKRPSVVLVKGSRFMKMERVVEALLQWAQPATGVTNAS